MLMRSRYRDLIRTQEEVLRYITVVGILQILTNLEMLGIVKRPVVHIRRHKIERGTRSTRKPPKKCTKKNKMYPCKLRLSQEMTTVLVNEFNFVKEKR